MNTDRTTYDDTPIFPGQILAAFGRIVEPTAWAFRDVVPARDPKTGAPAEIPNESRICVVRSDPSDKHWDRVRVLDGPLAGREFLLDAEMYCVSAEGRPGAKAE